MATDKNQAKAVELILSAITNLGDGKGTTLQKITRFITTQYDVEESDVIQPVMTALRRGIAFGFLKKRGMNYRLAVSTTPVRQRTSTRGRSLKKPTKRAGKRRTRSRSDSRSRNRARRSKRRA